LGYSIVIVLHVVAVVLWIGGVGFVTMVLFPALQVMEDSMEKVRFFLRAEKRFSTLAKAYIVLVGITGALLFINRGGFGSLTTGEAYLLGFKVFVWLLFAILLFGAERRLMKVLISAQTAPDVAFRRLSLFHWVMLILSLIAITFGIAITLDL
jgi:uncharacterized membrane protein